MSTQKAVTMLLTISLTAAAALLADEFELDWWTVDGGGEMFCTRGDYELSGTIGQPDASTVVMTGGDFELTGGFWPGVAKAPKVPSPFGPPQETEPNDVGPAPPP